LRTLHGSEFEFSLVYSTRRADADYMREIEGVKALGIRTYELPITGKPEPLRDIGASLKFMRILWKERPDLIHCHASKAGFIGRLFGRLALPRTPILFTPNVMSTQLNPMYTPLEAIAAVLTDRIVAASASEAEDLKQLWFLSRVPVSVVPLCVDTQGVTFIDRQGPANRDEWVVGGCGRIAMQKQPRLFFDLAARLVTRLPRVRFRWIGDFTPGDPDSDFIQHQLKDKPLPNTEVTGWVKNAMDEIRKLDIFLMLSRYESFGYVTADALLAGIPVIGTNVTGTRDLVCSGENGYLCEPNLDSIESALAELMNDPQLYRRFSRNAVSSIVSRYDLSVMTAALRDAYRLTLDRGH